MCEEWEGGERAALEPALGAASAAVGGGRAGSEQPFSLALVCQARWALHVEAVWVPFVLMAKRGCAAPCKAAGKVTLHKLACSEAGASVEKKDKG